MRGLYRGICVVSLFLLATAFAVTQTQPSDNTGGSAAPATSAEPTSGGFYRVGGSVSAPRVVYHVDPEYAEGARREKFQGTCILWVVVSAEGLPRDIRVARVLGHGLDEKAIEAVKQWRFEPARKDGKPVAVAVNVEVAFRLYSNGFEGSIAELEKRANAGDAKAELDLSEAYFQGRDVAKDEKAGYRLLLQAANQRLPKAQFQMGEYTASHGNRPGDDIVAYMWYAVAEHNGYKQSKKKMKELAARMSPQDIAEAQARAQSWPNPPVSTSPQ